MSSVLITGASRGIGRSITEHLSDRGWDVYATVRSAADADGLARLPHVHPLTLDVTDPAAVAGLPDLLPELLDGVVNNAGIFVNGPLETVPAARLAEQLQVNTIAPLAVTQAVLPALRRGRGRVVFMSSTSGLYTTPGTGAYNASKYALEAIGDALRMELRPWGLAVSLIEPGPIRTDAWASTDADHDQLVDTLSTEHRALYASQLAGTKRLMRVIAKQAADPVKVAKAVEHALTSPRPKARYLLDASSRAQKTLMRTAPTSLTDSLLARLTGTSGA